MVETSGDSDSRLIGLDRGERAAIALGMAIGAELILIDDRKGAQAASALGFQTTGTLGILDLAASRGLIRLREAMATLGETNFRYRKELIEELLAKYERLDD